MKDKLVIIPAFNEAGCIVNTVNDIIENAPEFDYVVINDCSRDDTYKLCLEHGFNVVNLPINSGIGAAVQTGYLYAKRYGYKYAIQVDGDGQHDVRYVSKIIKPILDLKADMVIGSRFIEDIDTFKSSRARRVGIKVISLFMKFATGRKIYDTTSGFRACSKELIYDFSLSYPSEYPEPITTVEVLKKGYKVDELSVEMNERDGGVSSIRAWKSIYYMLNVCLALLAVKIRRYKRCR